MSITKAKLALYVLVPAGMALGLAGFAAADSKSCHSAQETWQSQDAAMQFALDKGWSVQEIEIDDGCYELEGMTADGKRFEAKLDPANLTVIKMEHDDDDDHKGYGERSGYGDHDDDHDDGHEDDDDDDDDASAMASPAPAGTVAPPQNGLFGSDAAPKVDVN